MDLTSGLNNLNDIPGRVLLERQSVGTSRGEYLGHQPKDSSRLGVLYLISARH